MSEISTLAHIEPGALLGPGVSVGPFTHIFGNCVIGENTQIGSHCSLGVPSSNAEGSPLVIGANSLIRSHSVFYEGSVFGPNLTTGHQVSVREMVIAGKDLQLGTAADLQGHQTIGDFVRIYNGAHISRLTKIGSYVWIFPYVAFTNDPHPPSDGYLSGATVGDYSVIGTRATIMPGVKIGSDSLVGAGSLVSMDVPESFFVTGLPAKKICKVELIQLKDGSGPAYPWRRHFFRGFPAEQLIDWVAEFKSSQH